MMAVLMDFEHLDMLKEAIGEDLNEILEVFIENTPNSLELMQKAFDAKDADSLRLHAHTLKGSAANVGATLLAEQAKVVEMAVKAHQLDGLSDNIYEIETTFSEVRNQLNHYKK